MKYHFYLQYFGVSYLLFQSFFLAAYSDPCPNSCSSHGRCSLPNRECECFDQYTGADCFLKVCPKGIAWAQVASGIDQSHDLAECSNMGTCDRSTGSCTCRDGFEGNACERLACPENCQGVGQCQSLSYYASTKDPGYGTVYRYDDVWDADKLFGCRCDEGYEGMDCSLRACPVGDDPLTGGLITSSANPQQYNEIQQISCKANGGRFTLTFQQQTTGFIPYNAKESVIREKLEALPGLGPNSIKIAYYATAQACTASGAVFTIEFLQNFGPLSLIQGNEEYLTVAGSVSAVILSISHLVRGNKENLPCSNRGTCDPSSGICECSNNFLSSNGYNALGSRGDCGYESVFTQACPGLISCSGHGYCSDQPSYRCVCNRGWMGADCSEQLCPSDYAWFDYPAEENSMHIPSSSAALTECSSYGLCDRVTGTCKCRSGFTGSSCNRLSCPSSSSDPTSGESDLICSNHGTCYDIGTLATLATINGDNAGYTYGSDPNDPYTWDHDRVQGCYCDVGYAGYDCSLHTCPTGHNPDATHQVNEIQRITCTSSSATVANVSTGIIELTFRQQTTISFSATISTNELRLRLEELSSINEVTVQLYNSTAADQLCIQDNSNTFMITFLSNPGNLPLLQALSQQVGSLLIEEVQAGTKEELVCSGRGLCDDTTGICQCFTGYGSSDGQGRAGSKGDCGYIEPHQNLIISN